MIIQYYSYDIWYLNFNHTKVFEVLEAYFVHENSSNSSEPISKPKCQQNFNMRHIPIK